MHHHTWSVRHQFTLICVKVRLGLNPNRSFSGYSFKQDPTSLCPSLESLPPGLGWYTQYHMETAPLKLKKRKEQKGPAGDPKPKITRLVVEQRIKAIL